MSSKSKRIGRWQHRNADGTMPPLPRARERSKREPRSERDAWQHFMEVVVRAVVS